MFLNNSIQNHQTLYLQFIYWQHAMEDVIYFRLRAFVLSINTIIWNLTGNI